MIGDNIKLLRDIRQMTQQELAKLVGISPGALAHIEKGTRNPSYEMLFKLADALSVSVLNLLLSKEEIDRFYYDAEIARRYPGSEKLKEMLNQVLENNTAWDKTRRVAIIDITDLK